MFAAFLRGVMPYNCAMTDLRACLTAAGFSDVKTVLASGNVVFSSSLTNESRLRDATEAAIVAHFGRSFQTLIRSIASLEALLASDPFANFPLPADAKRVVTFLRAAPRARVTLPAAREGARILAVRGTEAFTAYTREATGPVFMTLIEETFGKDVTTRTWETVRKVVAAAR